MKLVLLALLAFARQDEGADDSAPWLGVSLNTKTPVVVEGVYGGSPAESVGIAVGDVIRSINGAEITKSDQVVKAVLAAGVGKTLKIHLVSKAGERDVVAKLASRPDLRVLQKQQLIGKTAPDFPIKKAQGVYAPQLSSLKGQVVLLDFWATWCGPCMQALPHLQQMHERLGKKGLRIIGVTNDPWEKVGDVVKQRRITYGQISDESNAIGMQYIVTALPTLVLIGKDGKVRSVTIGDWGTVEQQITELLQ
jgi:peroxiredoxin